MNVPRTARLGSLALIGTAMLWASNNVVSRAIREITPLPALVFWRWFLAVVLLTAIAWPGLRKDWPFVRANWREIVPNATLGVGIFSYFLLGGTYLSLALEVGILNATTPLWVALFTVLSRQADLGWRAAIALPLAFAGTLLTISKGDLASVGSIGLGGGNLLVLLGAISFAWYSIRARNWSREISALTITVVSAWCGCLTIMLPGYAAWVLTGGPWIAWRTEELGVSALAMAYIALGPTMIGNVLYLFGVTCVGPTRAATYLYLVPCFVAVLSIGFLGEELEWFHVAGFLIIVAGLALLGRPPAASVKPQAS